MNKENNRNIFYFKLRGLAGSDVSGGRDPSEKKRRAGVRALRSGYGNRIRVKYTAKWGVQIAGMIFQTHSGSGSFFLMQITGKHATMIREKILKKYLTFPLMEAV